MNKLLAYSLMFLSLFASTSAWAGSDYYAKLTVSCSGTGDGKIYASTASASSPAYQTDAMEVTATKNAQSAPTLTFYIYAEAQSGSKFNGWTATDGVTIANATSASTTATMKGSTSTATGTVTANFEKETLTAFSVTYLAPQNGSYTVDGTTVGSGGLTSAGYTEVYKPRLVATAADGYAFNGWYTTTDGGVTKTPLSQESPYTASFIAGATVGADFVPCVKVTTTAALTTSLANDTVIEIPTGTAISLDSNATLASGKTLIVNGELYVSAIFTNNGTITGGGAIITLKKLVTQTCASGDTPFKTSCVVDSYNKKYYKTTIESMSGAVSGTAPGCTVKNGARVVRNGDIVAQCGWPTDMTPAILSCTFNATKAVNAITGFNNPCYYANNTSNIGKALLAAKNSPSSVMLLLLSNVTVDNDVVLSDKGLYVVQTTYNKFSGDYGTIDLANNTWTVSPKNFHSYSHTILNGKLAITTLMYGGTLNCFNLGLASSKSYLLTNQIKVDGGANINIYDCTTDKVFGSYNGSGTPNGSINFYSGSETIYNTSNFASTKSAYHIYGGRWKTQPDESYIADAMKSDYAFYQTSEDDTSFSLKLKTDQTVVTFDDGNDDVKKYESLAEAFNALSSIEASSVKMTMLKNATLASAVTIPAGKTVEIELNGMCITASSGFVVNNGTFLIGDCTGNLASTGGRVVVSSGKFLQNNGTAEITYGYYTGDIDLIDGTLTTHHGYFAGAVTATDKSCADLRGGRFAKDVTALLADGYYQKSTYVGPFPKPDISREWVTSNGGYWRYSMKTLPQADLDLYNNPSSKKDDYSLENWKRRAEVMSMVTPYLNYVVDIGVGFDRNIAKDSATARVTDPVGITQNLDTDVAANELYRVFSPYFVQQGTSQKRYSAFLATGSGFEDFQTTTFGITTSTEGNYGTTADLRIDLCSGSDTSLTSVYALMSEYVALSAGKTNQAMIQPASGAATFYATIAEAVEACEEGGTVKLCNNIDSTDTITISKAVTIDTNGMKFKGSIVEGKHCKLTRQDTVLDIEKYIGKVHTTYTMTKMTPEEIINNTTEGAANIAITEDTVLDLAEINVNKKFTLDKDSIFSHAIYWDDNGKYLACADDGTLTVKTVKTGETGETVEPANGFTSFQSYVLGLNAADANSKPYLKSGPNNDPANISFVFGGIKVREISGIKVEYAVEYANDPDFDSPASTSTSTSPEISAPLPISGNKVMYYRPVITIERK